MCLELCEVWYAYGYHRSAPFLTLLIDVDPIHNSTALKSAGGSHLHRQEGDGAAAGLKSMG
jgi:hypothetical protein